MKPKLFSPGGPSFSWLTTAKAVDSEGKNSSTTLESTALAVAQTAGLSSMYEQSVSKEALTSPKVAVIIVSYNTSALLCGCLRSLQDVTLPLRILVVDNASKDDTVDLVQAYFRDVQLIGLGKNVGFAAANNIGLRECGFSDGQTPESTSLSSQSALPEFVLLLNPDTTVHPGAIEALVAFLQAHPRVGLVGPQLLNPDGTWQPAAFRFPTLLMSLFEVFPPGECLPGRWYNSWAHGRYPQTPTPSPIDHPLGACMLVRREVLPQVGLLDERYFIYCEELDWCWRIRQAGWAIWQVPQAQVTHVGGAATSQVHEQMFGALHQSRLIFLQRHYAPNFVRAHRLITFIGLLRKIFQTWAAFRRQQLTYSAFQAQLRAYSKVLAILVVA